jgi:predicted N-acetyltransferase YhbS
MADVIRTRPDFRGSTRVALMRGDEELSRALVFPMTIRIGRAEVRMDGIGGVATADAHRNRGYSRRVMEAAVHLMTAGDAALSTLYGIPHFYPRFGYATLGPEYTVAPASLDERADLPTGYSDRPGEPGDLLALQQLYRNETARSVGPEVRGGDWWVWKELETALAAGAGEVRVLEREGRIAGYAWRASFGWWMEQIAEDRPPALRIGEAFAVDPGAAEAVLALCRRWSRDLGLPVVTLAVPPDCRVGQAAQLQNCRVTALYGDESEFMGRAVGLRALMQAMLPELEARWEVAGLPPFAATIVTGGERATISGDETGIAVDAGLPGDIEVALDAGTLARLALGGFEPRLALSRSDAPAAMMRVLEALFPKRTPYIYPADRF